MHTRQIFILFYLVPFGMCVSSIVCLTMSFGGYNKTLVCFYFQALFALYVLGSCLMILFILWPAPVAVLTCCNPLLKVQCVALVCVCVGAGEV